jgi:predicted nucleic acid-binding protein
VIGAAPAGMLLNYVDSNALVKRYVSDTGAAWVTQLCETQPVVVSILAIPEVASALARRARAGELTAAQRDTIFHQLLADTHSYIVVSLHKTIVQRAARLLLTASSAPEPIRLRTLDALHLSSAQWTFARARRRGIATGVFVSADLALLAAAQWVGLATENPERHT